MSDSASIPALPQTFAHGHDLYDFIMATIEPDLVTAQIPALPEKYKDETPEQRKQRAARYEAAFALYKQRLEEYTAYWHRQFNGHKHEVIASLEADHRATDARALDALDLSISRQ